MTPIALAAAEGQWEVVKDLTKHCGNYDGHDFSSVTLCCVCGGEAVTATTTTTRRVWHTMILTSRLLIPMVTRASTTWQICGNYDGHVYGSVTLRCVCVGEAVTHHDNATTSLSCHDTDFKAVDPDGYPCWHYLTKHCGNYDAMTTVR